MKKNFFLVMLAIASAVTFNSCTKKGENDPFLSLRSRKARVVGEWKMTDYKATDTDASGTTTVTSNGSTYTVTSPFGNMSGTISWEYAFDKDGTYTYSSVEDGNSESGKGMWNFTSGIGELKRKSQLTTYETSSTNAGGTSTWTGNYVDRAVDLLELRSKKMVWYYKVTSVNSSGQSSTYEETITWEPK
ncbi:MAG: DUF5004 domain-containing protein [Bacteroidia bacterium]|nr:DUF5004 domain-containing protein [Bacteroidia bacterium]